MRRSWSSARAWTSSARRWPGWGTSCGAAWSCATWARCRPTASPARTRVHGLITGLLTLPLAPVRGTVWVAERILEQAESEFYDEGAIRAQLMEIEAAREAGEIDEASAAQAEDALLERLMARRG